MSRGLVLLIVAATTASAQAAISACWSALPDFETTVVNAAYPVCNSQYAADNAKYMANPKCNTVYLYDAATCDPIAANYMKCALKAAKLLKADNTFDDAAFKAMLKNCSADATFIAAYPTCKNSTMKYLNFDQLFRCLIDALRTAHA
ncbi:uncharacterized protein LOC108677000 [Hyalella azteca]|uniref:Uncharacterized protein LOC108677000 n=1 Tax=Hyalella azteca TaxID=294128 RepID=A0A8B7P3L2_HYAAZ|nr:uncharacterized protein LOC108677000 [Hyalella azteca]